MGNLQRLKKGPVLSFYLSTGLWPQWWRFSVLFSMARQKRWKLPPTELRSIVRLKRESITMSRKHLHQNTHHFLCCCQMHDYNLVKSTLVVHQRKNTSSCGKRTHRIYGYALPRSSRWLCSRHRFWHLKLAHHLASMARLTDPEATRPWSSGMPSS